MQPAVQTGSTTAATPMSCRIAGVIVHIQQGHDADTGSVCHKYACRALVRITSVSECGPGVSAAPTEGDTVAIRFAYSLTKTAIALPMMRPQYPGLKKGSAFVANAEQRLQMGGGSEYVVYGYEAK